MRILRSFWKDTSGATAIEYGLLAGLISIAIITSVGAMGNNLANTFNMVAAKIN